MVLVLGIALLIIRLSRGFYFLGVSTGLTVLAVAVLQAWSNGWFLFYTYQLPAGHPWTMRMFLYFWVYDIPIRFAPAFLAGVVFCVASLFKKTRKNTAHFLISAWIFSALLISYSSRIHEGGWVNVLIPLHVGLAIAAGLLAGYLSRHTQFSFKGRPVLAHSLVFIAVIVQLGLLFYLPGGFIPTAEDREYGEKLLEFTKSETGRIFYIGSPYLNDLAGKRSNAHELTLISIINIRTDGDEVKTRIREEFKRAITSGDFDAIVLDGPMYSGFMRRLIYSNYSVAKRLLPEGLMNNSGWIQPRPQLLLLPKSAHMCWPGTSRDGKSAGSCEIEINLFSDQR